MIKDTLLYKLYSYNVHIGHIDNYNSALNGFITGIRLNYYIIDVNKMFFLLKKVIFFLKTLSLNNGSLLFHYSKYMSLDIISKCALFSIYKYSNQQMITYNWKYGSISNFFFSFYELLKQVTNSWIKQHSTLFNLEKKLNIYYNTNIEFKKLDSFNYNFLNSPSSESKKKHFSKKEDSYKSYRNWYLNWIKKKSTYSFWKGKNTSLKTNSFLRKICLNDLNSIFNKKKIKNFKSFLLKIFYFISIRKTNSFLLRNSDNSRKSRVKAKDVLYEYIHNKFISYWRYILYFKSFNNFYQIPDCLFSVFPDNNDMPINEYTSSNLISIGLIDTVSNINNVHYPIISNDDSLILLLFYFTLFSNVFLENRLNLYSFLKNTR